MEQNNGTKTICLEVSAEAAEKSRNAWNMIEHNQIDGVFTFEYFYKDDKVCFCYTNQGMQSVKEYFDHKNGVFETLFFLCYRVYEILENGQDFLLDVDEYVLSPEQIYINQMEKKLKLCYLPGKEQGKKSEYLVLVEYLMEHTDHGDTEAVDFIYGLYDMLCSDGFSLGNLEVFWRTYQKEENKESVLFSKKPWKEMKDEGIDVAIEERKEKKETEEKFLSRWKLILNKEKIQGMAKEMIDYLPQEYLFPDKPNITVGRAYDGDIVLPFHSICRKGIAFYLQKGELYIRNSKEGVVAELNGKKILSDKNVLCQSGDLFCLGGIPFTIIKI